MQLVTSAYKRQSLISAQNTRTSTARWYFLNTQELPKNTMLPLQYSRTSTTCCYLHNTQELSQHGDTSSTHKNRTLLALQRSITYTACWYLHNTQEVPYDADTSTTHKTFHSMLLLPQHIRTSAARWYFHKKKMQLVMSANKSQSLTPTQHKITSTACWYLLNTQELPQNVNTSATFNNFHSILTSS